MNTNNLPDKEFIVVIIRIFTKLESKTGKLNENFNKNF